MENFILRKTLPDENGWQHYHHEHQAPTLLRQEERLIYWKYLPNQAIICFNKLISKERNPQSTTTPKKSTNKIEIQVAITEN